VGLGIAVGSCSGSGCGPVGQVVGSFSSAPTSLPDNGFFDDNGTSSIVGCGSHPQATGINDLGHIVGYGGNTATTTGFIYPSCASIQYPGAPFTKPTSINDADWITGSYSMGGTDSEHGFVAFINSDGTYRYASFDDPVGTRPQTFPQAIDGFGRIVGWGDSISAGFLDDFGGSANDPGSAANFSLITNGSGVQANGINDNGEVSGVLGSPSGSSDGFLLYGGSFYPPTPIITSGFQHYSAPYGLFGINDAGQVVGWSYDGSGNSRPYKGFVAVPAH
jgi:hypothetical protein